MTKLMPLQLTVSSVNKIHIGLTFLVPDHLGSLKKGPLNGGVYICMYACIYLCMYLFIYDGNNDGGLC